MFKSMFLLMMRHLKVNIRQPVWIFFNLVQPFVWLLLFSQLFSGLTDIPGFPVKNYVQYLTPGIIIMTCLFSAGYSGIGILQDMEKKLVDKLIVASVSTVSVVLARAVANCILVFFQVTVLMAVAYMLGFRIGFSIMTILLIYVTVFFTALLIGMLSNFMAIVSRRQEALVFMANFITLPLMFLSTAMMPKDYSPRWIQQVTKFNPVNLAVESIRDLAELQINIGQVLFTIGVFAFISAIFVMLSCIKLRKLYE